MDHDENSRRCLDCGIKLRAVLLSPGLADEIQGPHSARRDQGDAGLSHSGPCQGVTNLDEFIRLDIEYLSLPKGRVRQERDGESHDAGGIWSVRFHGIVRPRFAPDVLLASLWRKACTIAGKSSVWS
jgi:hypothetical protein